MLDVLYYLIVQPIVFFAELIFSLIFRLTSSQGIAIVGISIFVNLLCLPLYAMADRVQDEERIKQQSMSRWVDHIKRTFSGDERYMMLSAYYAEQHYHPMRALIGSLSLLLQIPFFVAAYTYLSNLDLLRNASFLFMGNLGAPDALIHIGAFEANILPIVMTLLNCVSTAVYTRGLPLRDKAQAYILAAVFLVLLYQSPSGLVFYWTCNQLFSLLKNIFMKVIDNPRKWALIIAEIAVIGAISYLLISGKAHKPKQLIFVISMFVAFEAIWIQMIRPTQAKESGKEEGILESRKVSVQFVLSSCLIVCLLGVLIPSALIADSPTEFMQPLGSTNPLRYVLYTTCVGGGICLWLGVYFALSKEKGKRIISLILWCLAGACLVEYFFFGKGLGTITPELVFDNGVLYSPKEQLFNLFALALLACVLAVIWKWANKVVTPILGIMAVAVLVMSAPNLLLINSAFKEARAEYDNASQGRPLIDDDGIPNQIYHLSKTEQNVVVIFLDRAISGYVPYIMQERPELVNQFDGFTYYPNTISFGCFTNFGAPPLYGGYEYTPMEMNARNDELIGDKHDEALLVMPTIFSSAGYRTTVFNPPYAGNYEWSCDVSMYDSLPNTEAYAYSQVEDFIAVGNERYGIVDSTELSRNFFCYSFFKVIPECFQTRFYDGGNYLSSRVTRPPAPSLVREYAVLDMLPDMTSIESGAGGFVLLCDNITHQPDFLQLPDYEPFAFIDNTGLEDPSRFVFNGRAMHMETEAQLTHYHVNAAALIQLGQWFDWMREQGVYDNTRIIIVSDHGRDLRNFDGWTIDDMLDVEYVNPLLMVKDYGASGFYTSDEFMTNADVPTLALTGLIENPINPYTGVPINSDEKTEHDQIITASRLYETTENNGYIFDTSDAPWYSVHDDIFDMNNWQRLS